MLINILTFLSSPLILYYKKVLQSYQEVSVPATSSTHSIRYQIKFICERFFQNCFKMFYSPFVIDCCSNGMGHHNFGAIGLEVTWNYLLFWEKLIGQDGMGG
ncbi:hypothetical protein CEXT_391691 [Caerostris extrusa]|uniref:Uncharacterized protein n=1 Tax=Caerostris extrusa TaxID=172846 RepID=A0AAV4UZS2_CAEEX|nr:hypothetical protein CEXT_391691 [Caerostris extrusa]